MTIFCWLPPDRKRTSWASDGVLICSRRDGGARGLADRPRLQEDAEREKAAKARHHDVGGDVHRGGEPEPLAVLRQIPDPQAHGVARRADRDRLATDDDLAAVERVGPEDRPRHLGPSRSHQAGEAEDLALAQLEAHVPDRLAAPQVADLEHGLAGRRIGDRRLGLGEAAPDHHGDDRVHRRRGGRHGADVLAVAHDGDAVRDLLQLVHLVRDVDDADALGLELADDPEQLGDLGIVQRRGRLVHDQDLGLERQGLGDLHHLLPGDRELADFGARIEPEVQSGEDGRGVAVQGLLVEQEPEGPLGLAADEDVLRGGEVVHQVELLMNDADAEVLRRTGRRNIDGHAVDADFAGVLRIDSGEDLHQGRLAGAVLPDEGVDLAGKELETGLPQRLHAGKSLVEIGDRDERRHGIRPVRFGSARRKSARPKEGPFIRP